MDDTTVYLVHVTTPFPKPMTPFPDVFVESDLISREQIEKEHEVLAGQRLMESRDTLPSKWIVIPQHRVGQPAREILDAIKGDNVDLVVLGATGMDEVSSGLGSVAQKVSRYAPCSVLLARQPGTRVGRVLVALDDSDDTRRVLDYVAASPWLNKATVTLAHVVEDRYLHESRIAASQFAGSEAYLTRLQRALTREAQDFLGRQADIMRDKGVRVDTLVLEGDPAQVMQDRASTGGFDLLVMGAKGRHGLAGFLLGSTSQRVMRQAATSVLLVRTS
jgi:nucleotide-binding universal stress UspA family protein